MDFPPRNQYSVLTGGSSTFEFRSLDFYPYEYLKNYPQFEEAFQNVLGDAASGPLSVSQLTTRFDAMAPAVRRSIEAEAMRWGAPDRLPEWSSTYTEVVSGSVFTRYHSTQFFRRFVAEDDAKLDNQEYPNASLRALLSRAFSLGLYNYSY